MRSDIVTIEPEIIQFGRQQSHTIKIINHTNNPLSNFFFCLYNVEKFAFTPDSFSLAPNQHKLVTVVLKIKSARSVAKEFAYLKSTQINKRITLVVNQFQSPDVKVRAGGEEGMEDMNTLSSRDYKDVQTQAIEKIIREKEAYIAMLEKERESVNRSINFRTEESGEKSGVKSADKRRDIDELEMKLALVQNERQSAVKENMAVHSKFEEFRKMCEADLQNYQKISHEYREKIEQNDKLHEEINYLQTQGTQFLSKIEEKEAKVRELQQFNRKTIEDGKKEVEKKLSNMEQRLKEQKNNYQQSAAYAEERIKQLERQLDDGHGLRQKTQYYEKELKKREEEIKNLMMAVETERSELKGMEGQKKKAIKLQLANQNITERNHELTSRVKQLEKVNNNLREEIFVHKSKSVDNDASSEKMNQYLQIALQSCRNENDALKRTKNELQKSLEQIMSMNRQSHDTSKNMSDQVTKYKEQIKLLHQIKDNLQRRHEQMKQEHHLSMMQLKTQNIELLQKLSLGETSKREDIIRHLEEQIFMLKKDLAKSNVMVNELTSKNEQFVVDNTKLTEKVKKYKKEAKRELRSINQTAINQLNREQEDKQKMAERITELQGVILNYSCDKMRDDKEHGLTRERERASSRGIGIKDQRREIQYSQGSNSDAFNELGELREINNFIKTEEEKFNKIYGTQPESDQDDDKFDPRPIFRVIKFFQRIQGKLDLSKTESNLLNVKEVREIEYLKGRLRQLQAVKQDKQNISSINLNKTREHCSQLLQFVRQEMKSQYKKLNETLKLSQQKYELLKKKIYEQYRSRIIDNLNKKDKHTMGQLQSILERFIDGMSNLSHKEAVLHKEIKLKQSARKQNNQLKEKVNELNYLLQEKKSHCSRDPIKLIYNEGELEWQESLKRQAQFLTLTAEHQRMKEELELVDTELADCKQDLKHLDKELDEKSNEILKLKKYQIEIQSNYEGQIQRQYEIIEENKRKIMEMTKTTKETGKHYHKEKEYHTIKESNDRQKEVIRQLKEKERMLEELLDETHRGKEKEKHKAFDQQRIVESMRDLTQNNRVLRTENTQLKEKLNKLEDQMEKKTLYMKNLKGDIEDGRIRVQRKEEAENDLIRDENKKMVKECQKIREELDKLRKKKEKELSELKNEIDRLKNENIITEKSLESIIRALMDTVRKVYNRLRRVMKRRRNTETDDHSKIFQNFQGVHVNALKIDEVFEQVLTVFEAQ